LPKVEQYEIASQLRRSSKSISANIVEEFCRKRYKAKLVRFLVFTHSSCNETIGWMEYIKDCYPDFENSAEEILSKLGELGRRLDGFVRTVERNHKS
jgi:four helix bundle protein